MKKIIPVAVIIVIALVAVIGIKNINKPKNNESDNASETPAPNSKSIDTLSENLKPKVTIKTRTDGRALTVTFSNLKNFDTLQYELSYLTKNDIPQGVIGTPISLNGQDSVEKELLLGTCSGTVTLKCRYDEEVHQVSLAVRYSDKNGDVYDQTLEYSL